MWEQEARARTGLEIYYTRQQDLEDNPYRRRRKAYVHVGVLAERQIRRGMVINAENLLDHGRRGTIR